jgi:hypothetical protein
MKDKALQDMFGPCLKCSKSGGPWSNIDGANKEEKGPCGINQKAQNDQGTIEAVT